jgi:hypothetical protein
MQKMTIEEYLKQKLDVTPIPPRDYKLSEVVKVVLSQRSVIPRSLMGILLLLGFSLFCIIKMGHHENDIYLVLIGFPIILFLGFFVPFHMIKTAILALKNGCIGEIEFIEINRTTFGSIKWKCLVRTQKNDFEQTFTSEASWKDEAVKANKFRAIVYPRKNKILYILGILD